MANKAETFTKEQIPIKNLGQLVLISEPIDLTKLDREGEGIIVTDLEFNVNNFGELIENSDAVPIESKNSGKQLIYFASGVARKILLGVDPASVLNLKLSSKNLEEMRLYLNIWQAALYKYLTERKDDPQIRQFLGNDGSPRNVLNFLNEVWNTERQLNTSVDESRFVEVVRRFQSIIAEENKKEQGDRINSIKDLFNSLDISSEELPASEEKLGRYFLEQMNLEEYEGKLDPDFYKAMDLLRKNAVFQRDDEGNLTDKINPDAISTYLALLHVLGEESMGEFFATFLEENGYSSIADINQRIFSYVNGLDDDERAVLKNEIKDDVDDIRNEVIKVKVDSLIDQWRAESEREGTKIDIDDALASLDVPEWLKNEIDKRNIVGFVRGNMIIDGTARLVTSRDRPSKNHSVDVGQTRLEGNTERLVVEAKDRQRKFELENIRRLAIIEKAKRAFKRAKRQGSRIDVRQRFDNWVKVYREWEEWARKRGEKNLSEYLPPAIRRFVHYPDGRFVRRRIYNLPEAAQKDYAAVQAYGIFERKDGEVIPVRENIVKYLALLHVLDLSYLRTGKNLVGNIYIAKWFNNLPANEKAILLRDVMSKVAEYRDVAMPAKLTKSKVKSPNELREVVEQSLQDIKYRENKEKYLRLKKRLEGKILDKNEREELRARFKNLKEQQLLIRLLITLRNDLRQMT